MDKKISYKKKDIKRYKKLNKQIKKDKIKLNYLNIEQEIDFKLPNNLFSFILKEKRPDLIKYTESYKIIVKKLERGNNPWLKKVTSLGLYDEKTGILEYHIDKKKYNNNILSLLWLLFHEFRHHVQFNDQNILSCLKNKNRKKWLNYYNKDINSVLHVFHEVDPIEVDANTFACEMLGIPYPNSKFSITNKTLKRLRDKK